MKLFTPILFTLLAIALFFVVVDPLRRDVSGLKGEIVAYNLALDNSTYLEKTQDALLDAYKNIKSEDKERLERFLPNTVNNIKFILEIERLANQYSMPIKNIKFETPAVASQANGNNSNLVISSEPTSAKPYGAFTIEFMTEGTYDSFNRFLKDMEYNLRLVDVKSISFSVPSPTTKPAEGTDPNVYDYSLKVETYWLK
jgi:hypothetical protein